MPRRRAIGRPPLKWLPASALTEALPAGTALHLDRGTAPRVRGRLAGVDDAVAYLTVRGAEVAVPTASVVRLRVLTGLFDGGDPVVRVGVPAMDWRGGVVRCRGREVYVECPDGSFAWLDESEIERAEDREALDNEEVSNYARA